MSWQREINRQLSHRNQNLIEKGNKFCQFCSVENYICQFAWNCALLNLLSRENGSKGVIIFEMHLEKKQIYEWNEFRKNVV